MKHSWKAFIKIGIVCYLNTTHFADLFLILTRTFSPNLCPYYG